MKFIQNQAHDSNTFFISLSRLLERAAYYGLRAVVVLYMIGETINLEDDKALKIYSLFTGSIVFTQLLGGILGDLLIGSKKAIYLGGVLQALGAFLFCFGNESSLYLGLIFITVGGGFYTPNILSNFGKNYLSKTALLDSGFTIFYLSINLGAVLGMYILTQIADNYSYNLAFILAGLLYLSSLIPLLYSKIRHTKQKVIQQKSLEKRVFYILITFLIIGVFWSIYDISHFKLYNLQRELGKISELDLQNFQLSAFNNIILILMSIIALVGWAYFYYSQFLKLLLGFLFFAIGLGILFLIPEYLQGKHFIVYMLSLVLINLSEIHIAPVIYATITKYGNPRSLSILMSLSFIPAKLSLIIIGLFSDQFYNNSNFGIIISIAISIFFVLFLLVLLFLKKQKVF